MMTELRVPRPVLMTYHLAEILGIEQRLERVDEGTGVVMLTEAEFLGFGADLVHWGEPDENGRYVPTLFSSVAGRT